VRTKRTPPRLQIYGFMPWFLRNQPESTGSISRRLFRSRGAGQALGIFDRFNHAALVGDSFARDVEGGAMIDGCADDRQAERDVDAG
jgi:hypothetical protein